ncbi:MAG TPA: STAS domain-containing protein [Acidimicrobiales bacterium]|nr:STAS domain-containing protein [Acidimicrobiales bacterium]
MAREQPPTTRPPGSVQLAELRVTSPAGAPAAVLGVAGEIDAANAGGVRQRISELIEAGVELVIVDLRSLDHLGAAGLGVLAGGASRLRQRGGDLVLVRPERGPISRVLRLTGIDSALAVYRSPREALANS